MAADLRQHQQETATDLINFSKENHTWIIGRISAAGIS